MLTSLALGLGALALITIVLTLLDMHRFRRVVERDFTSVAIALRKRRLAHERITQVVSRLDLRVPKIRYIGEPEPEAAPFQLEQKDWADDRLATRKLTQGDTFLPVDFQHDLW